MTGHLLRTDCPEFRRKLSWEMIGKPIFMIVGFLGKSLQHRIPPKCSLEIPAGFKLSLGGPWAPEGPLPWDPLGSEGPLPWDPLGSHASPPMGSLGLPRVPSLGIPWARKGPLQWDPLGSQGCPPIGPPPGKHNRKINQVGKGYCVTCLKH